VRNLILSRLPVGEFPDSSWKYVRLLDSTTSILDQLKTNGNDSSSWLASLPEEACSEPYGPGKWSIKDTVCHLSDDERIYVYRALRFARGDQTILSGFDQDLYAASAVANRRTMRDLIDEFVSIRHSTLTVFNSLDEGALARRGSFEGREFTSRGLAFHIAGHELHHTKILRSFIQGRADAPQ
jgi:uncharacterized damage-inducible protein DinB